MSDDLISRKAAIAVADSSDYVGLSVEDVKKVTDEVVKGLKQLPSEQLEFIRCKDCKYSEYWYGNKRRCFLWHEIGIDVFEDGYCNYAERYDSQRR